MSRTTAVAVGLVTVVVLGLLAGVGNVAATPPEDGYVVEQDGICQPIDPLETDESIEAFYDYRDHETHPEGVDRLYSSYGTTDYQESDTSLLFVHEGTDGTNLVMVHDELEGNTSGGVITFDIAGLPHESDWTVMNDAYEGETNHDEFDRGDGWASADWAYIQNRTGGGAIGPLDGPFALTLEPAFNEDADLYDADVAEEFDDENVTGHGGDWWDGGEIDEWHLLSGDADDPDRYELDSLAEPVTVRAGSCDDPTVSYDRIDDGLEATIEDAGPEEPISLQPTSGTDTGVSFDRFDATDLPSETSIAFENSEHGPSDGDLDSLSALAVDSDAAGAGTVQFTVDAAVLANADLTPEEVVLYQADGEEWTEAETTHLEDRGGTHVYDAEVDSLTDLAVVADPNTDEERGLGTGVAGIVTVVTTLALTAVWVRGARGR